MLVLASGVFQYDSGVWNHNDGDFNDSEHSGDSHSKHPKPRCLRECGLGCAGVGLGGLGLLLS